MRKARTRYKMLLAIRSSREDREGNCKLTGSG